MLVLWASCSLILFISLNNVKTVLVTGGAGFLGSNLCRRLLADDFKVVALDNYYTGSESNVKELFSDPNFLFINHDITEKFDPPFKVDEIYNLACPASPPQYQKDPVYTFKTSIFGALNLLELANNQDAKILQASTSEIYGEPEISPQIEEYRGNVNSIGPRSCYDEGKRGAESLFFDFWRTKKTPIKVVRIFNTYGPRMSEDDGRVVSNFIVQALRGQPITVYGDGSQTRSFCYVEDLITGLQAMMDSGNEITGPVNLGNPEELTMAELAKKIISLTNSDSKLIYKPLPIDDPTQRRPDITKAKKVLNWSPKIGLEEGLSKTIEYFRTKL